MPGSFSRSSSWVPRCAQPVSATLEDANRWIDDPILEACEACHLEHLRTIDTTPTCRGARRRVRFLTVSQISRRTTKSRFGLILSALALASNSCVGARMTGAGFGGCAIALVSKDDRERFQNFVGSTYTKRTGLRPEFYVTEIGDGVRRIPSRAFS